MNQETTYASRFSIPETVLKFTSKTLSYSELTEFEFCEIVKYLQTNFEKGDHKLCNSSIEVLMVLLKESATLRISKNSDLLKSIIKYFIKLFNQLSDEFTQQNQNTQKELVRILSILAQIVYEDGGCRLPISRRFVMKLFMLDVNFIASCGRKKEVSRILSVLMEHLSCESDLLIEYGLFSRFRCILLQNFKIVSDKVSLQRLLRALCKTVKRKVLTYQEIMSSGVFKAIEKFFRNDEVNKILRHLNLPQLLRLEEPKQMSMCL